MGHDRFNQTSAKRAGDFLVEPVDLLCSIALVAAEEFIATVSGQHDFNSSLACEHLAVIGRNGRGVGEGFIVEPNHFRQNTEGIVRSQPRYDQLRSEVSCSDLGIFELIEPLFGKPDGEAGYRSVSDSR